MKQKTFFQKITIPVIVVGSLAFYFALYFYLTLGMTKITTIGNLVVYADNPDLKKEMLLVMDSCILRLEEMNIQTKTKQRIILCSNVNQYNIKTFFMHRNTLGVNQNLFNSILIAPADYKNNRQQKYDDRLFNRRLSDAIAHEITHLYIRERIGYLKNIYMSRSKNNWKIEGFCEYIAYSSSFNIKDGTDIFLNETVQPDHSLNSKLLKITYFYFKSRLKTDYLFSCKYLSFDEFMNTNFDEITLENEIREAMLDGVFSFVKQ